jgi:mono/diheme cytochrome c family protein
MKLLNVVLGLALLAAMAANLAVDRDPGTPARDYLPEMAYSRAAESYAADAALDGGTLLVPPDGTIARGASLVRYQATPADAARAGVELSAPPVDAAAVRRGQRVFQTFCTPCHGVGGAGDGAVVARGFPPPPSLLAPHARGLKDGQLFHILTYGQLNMPSYAGQIDAADRWRAIAYVRQLQGSGTP